MASDLHDAVIAIAGLVGEYRSALGQGAGSRAFPRKTRPLAQ